MGIFSPREGKRRNALTAPLFAEASHEVLVDTV